MLAEQLWDDAELPDGSLECGKTTGSAMPLCWSHAEYVSLVRSRRDQVVFDRIEPAYQRYVATPVLSRYEIWSFRHQTRQIARTKTLRLLIGARAVVRWTRNEWEDADDLECKSCAFSELFVTDLPTAELPTGTAVEFTFHWIDVDKWEGRNFSASVK